MHSDNKKRPIVTVVGEFKEQSPVPETRTAVAPLTPAAPIAQKLAQEPIKPAPTAKAVQPPQPAKITEQSTMRALLKKRVNIFSFQGDSAKPAFENVQVRYIDRYTIGVSYADEGPITVLFKHALLGIEPTT